MADAPRLLPCPFCFKHPGEVSAQCAQDDDSGLYLIWCDECSAEGPPHPSEDDAITAWNHRAPDPVREALIEIAREAQAVLYERAGPDSEHLTERELELYHSAGAALQRAGKAP